MSLFITSLNSGSNGNCYYIGNDKEAILVDAGISCREIEIRMKRLGLLMQKVKAIFVSHEHHDHIKGIHTLAKKHQLPVYITEATKKNGKLNLQKNLVISFAAHEPVVIGDLVIIPFPKLHDASDPYSFVISCKEIKVGVFTDIGAACPHVIKYFQQCHAAFLEANYDEAMLENGNYPYFLKTRIRGGMGHLSNRQALELFNSHKPAFMSHLFLSHLSKNNNCPDLVGSLFNKHAGDVKVIVASRYAETAVYHIRNTNNQDQKFRQSFVPRQLSFSFA
ncbi:MAG: MBL fold metallo-hydrolase [Chitinophagaceae bacterium]|nr:MBL fold metallo-hydrolase [Chitinophagaceae bacterium]